MAQIDRGREPFLSFLLVLEMNGIYLKYSLPWPREASLLKVMRLKPVVSFLSLPSSSFASLLLSLSLSNVLYLHLDLSQAPAAAMFSKTSAVAALACVAGALAWNNPVTHTIVVGDANGDTIYTPPFLVRSILIPPHPQSI